MTKTVLKYLIISLLFLPLTQQTFKLIKEKKLDGDIKIIRDKKFSWHQWWSGNYQEEKEKFLNTNFGLSKTFIRINNQMFFSFFNIAKANQVIIGKENYLFESNYIKAYYGTDFIGFDSIEKQTTKLKAIQDYLKSKNKLLFVVFAPGKASFYNQYIPASFQKTIINTNINSFTILCREKGVNFIDFNSWFLKIKDTTTAALFPQYGIHWSQYGMLLSTDSMIKYIENKKQITIPHRIISGSYISQSCFDNENDIEKGMNLFFELEKKQPLLQQDFTWQKDTSLFKPKVMVVADSYYWQIMGTNISNECFNSSEFWFYFNEINSNTPNAGKNPKELNLKSEFEKFDVVILLSTEANLARLGWGFIDKGADNIIRLPQ